MSAKAKAAVVSVVSNSVLTLGKLLIGTLSGSVSIISEAIHSGMDLLASLIAFFSVKTSDRPPDEEHPYGHEKIENLSGTIEAMLILGASAFILYESIRKLLHPGEVEHLGLGFGIMLISASVNFLVSRYLYAVAKKENSVALEADALHLKADVYTSAGVATGLLLVLLTGWTWLDPVVAILVALFILREAWEMLHNAFAPLMDATLPQEDLDVVVEVIEKNCEGKARFHDLRARKAGKSRIVDFHLTLPGEVNIRASHDLCDRIEHELEQRFQHTQVLIHVEPEEA